MAPKTFCCGHSEDRIYKTRVTQVTLEELFGDDRAVELPMEDNSMNEDFMPVRYLAKQLGITSSNTLKYVKKLGYKPKKLRTRESRGQWNAVITKKEAKAILAQRESEFIRGY